jgi:hypothetical protein
MKGLGGAALVDGVLQLLLFWSHWYCLLQLIESKLFPA